MFQLCKRHAECFDHYITLTTLRFYVRHLVGNAAGFENSFARFAQVLWHSCRAGVLP